jgi:hypothetical protein
VCVLFPRGLSFVWSACSCAALHGRLCIQELRNELRNKQLDNNDDKPVLFLMAHTICSFNCTRRLATLAPCQMPHLERVQPVAVTCHGASIFSTNGRWSDGCSGLQPGLPTLLHHNLLLHQLCSTQEPRQPPCRPLHHAPSRAVPRRMRRLLNLSRSRATRSAIGTVKYVFDSSEDLSAVAFRCC